MKKNIIVIILICFIAIAITGCGSNSNNSSSDNNKQNNEEQKETTTNYKDGYYEWSVGKYTLKTKINVMDYIDGEKWDIIL